MKRLDRRADQISLKIVLSCERWASGIFVANDFRDNIIVDRYDNVFATMHGEKINQLRSENSEYVLTWNVFRSLQEINSSLWSPAFFDRAFNAILAQPKVVTLDLWPTLAAPPCVEPLPEGRGQFGD